MSALEYERGRTEDMTTNSKETFSIFPEKTEETKDDEKKHEENNWDDYSDLDEFDFGEEGDDEEVIDVDELVDTQDETKAKVAKLDGKIESLIQIITKLESGLDQNSAHMEELKKEFEKRNPTQVEKMTLRAKKGYPFAESPDEYWAGKEAEGDYSPESDNNGVGDERYAITKNDVDNITDWDSIYKSIGNGDFHQDLKSILSL